VHNRPEVNEYLVKANAWPWACTLGSEAAVSRGTAAIHLKLEEPFQTDGSGRGTVQGRRRCGLAQGSEMEMECASPSFRMMHILLVLVHTYISHLAQHQADASGLCSCCRLLLLLLDFVCIKYYMGYVVCG